jgi:hypothetical protein
VDTNHAVDVYPNPGGFLRELRITGDTKGDEAGTKTRIEVDFNPILVR